MAVRPRSRRARSGRRYIVAGVVFAGLGITVALLLGALGGAPQTVLPARHQQVLVAARDLASRTPLSAEDVAVATYAVEDVPPGALLRAEDARGQSAAVDILKGQPLTSNLLIRNADAVANQHPSYLPVPSGYVAIPVPTSEQIGVAGYIQAGDYISIMAVIPSPQNQNVRTVYDNIHVIRAAPITAQPAPAAGGSLNKTGVSSSLVVVVTPCQAEFVDWFLVNAQLRYVLESSRDYKPSDSRIDQNCPSVAAAPGVTISDVNARWPGLGSELSIRENRPDPQNLGCAYLDTRPSGCGN